MHVVGSAFARLSCSKPVRCIVYTNVAPTASAVAVKRQDASGYGQPWQAQPCQSSKRVATEFARSCRPAAESFAEREQPGSEVGQGREYPGRFTGRGCARLADITSGVDDRTFASIDCVADDTHNMSDHVRERATFSAQDASFNYPWAAAPDIIRSNQKDAYFQSMLLTHLFGVIRSLYGARTAHNWSSEARTFTELLYLGLTTFVGNRTLGEEYCDIVQVEDDTRRLPSITRRSGYILSSILMPYILTRFLPAFRRRLRAKLEGSMRKSHRRRASSPARSKQPPSRGFQIQEYILKHLDSITSPAPVYAATLAVFYFSGAYYQLSKRVFGLRYIFTRKLEESDQRVGYEVLGVLLVLQMIMQGYLHMQDTYAHAQTLNVPSNAAALAGGSAIIDGGVEIATDTTIAAAPLLFEPPPGADPAAQKERVSKLTHTPLPETYRFHLEDPEVMQWIDGKQQRKCTLCLEPMKYPAVTTCGHVFCWQCASDWLREQPMCPLCRQSALVQHLLPLRG